MELDRSKLSPDLVALLDKSAELRAEASRLIEQAKQTDQHIVDRFCAFNPGDNVTVTDYSYNGKVICITGLSLAFVRKHVNSGSEITTVKIPYFRAVGLVLKKDGSPSMHSAGASFDLNNNPLPGYL